MVSVAVVLGVIIAIYDGEGIGEGHLTEDQYGRRFHATANSCARIAA
jgi:hypothetical protein